MTEMMTPPETLVPKIKTRKRRLVRPEDRKNSKSSCDRCKTKKLACKRENPNAGPEEPCIKCLNLGLVCQTTIQRKKKPRRPVENIGLHYKCLYMLIKGIFPDIDTNDIDALIRLGESHNVEMPSPFGYSSKEEQQDILEISVRLTGATYAEDTQLKTGGSEAVSEVREDAYQEAFIGAVQYRSPENISGGEAQTENVSKHITSEFIQAHSVQNGVPTHDMQPAIQDTQSHMQQKDEQTKEQTGSLSSPQQDSIIIDQGGICHFVGPFGAAGFLHQCVDLLRRSSTLESNLWDNYQKLFQSEIIISSKQEPLDSVQLKNMAAKRGAGFPYLGFTNRKESDHYLNTFLQQIHPRYPCFNEATIRSSYETFWMFLLLDISNEKMLNNTQVCTIYLIIILGWMYHPYSQTEESNGVCQMNETIAQQLITAVRFFISDMLLSPSLDGIRCMMLLSIYMDTNKRRDTGYCLIQAAARQAITIGLNRKSVTYCIDSEDLIKEMKMTWWTLFKLELSFSSQMGRSSCLHLEDVDIEGPTFSSPKVNYCFKESICITKLLYTLLEYRKQIRDDIMADTSLKAANTILQKFQNWWSQYNPESLEEGTAIGTSAFSSAMSLDMVFRYHYYVISLTLPVLLHVTHEAQCPKAATLDLIQQCVDSAISLAHTFKSVSENGLFNGTVLQDLFFIYHASMALVAGYICISKHQINLTNIKLHDVTNAIDTIRTTNLANFTTTSGSNTKISKFINILLNGLNILEFLGVDFVDSKTITARKAPIVHMSKLPGTQIHFKYSRVTAVSPILKPLDMDISKIFTADFDYRHAGNGIDNLESI